MFYQIYEFNHAALQPYRAFADATRLFYSNPMNPLAQTPFGRSIAGMAELFERTTRRYAKPAFGIEKTVVDWKEVAVTEKVVWSRPFCNLIHFERALPAGRKPDRKLLIVAPMSGHYATLLRGTVERMLPGHDVYITDWRDAKLVPASDGSFDLDDYIDYLIEFLEVIGERTGERPHMLAVCQPSVPAFAATALMNADKHRYRPKTLTMMGGPVDTRKAPTAINTLATQRPLSWFKNNVVATVPAIYPASGRKVYPGFLQLAGFMAMNLGDHLTSHWEMFKHLVVGDDESAEASRAFYDEYRSVCDMTAEFYLQTVDVVFQRHLLPKGRLMHRGRKVDPKAIADTALLAIEGERDDISGLGQTRAALDLAPKLAASKRKYFMAEDVGHYGIFNGRKWRERIAPVVDDWIAKHD